MNMTNYMALLAESQPWNLIAYMAIPVILAESLVATEFFVLFHRAKSGALRTFNKWIGIILGLYFSGIVVHLLLTTIPGLNWRGPADIIAVTAYLAGAIPLLSIALLELGVAGKNKNEDERLKFHFILITIFLVLSHIAMVFGMLDPEVMGWSPGNTPMMEHHH
jgi:uncharacterized membrane protein YidH (DUF202 family)